MNGSSGEPACGVEPAIARAVLDRLAASAAQPGPSDDDSAGASLLRRHDRGWVVEYRPPGGPAVIAKYYVDAERAVAAHRVLRHVARHGFGPASSMRVPQPLGVYRWLGVLLMRRAPGERLSGMAGAGVAWQRGLRGAGGWLARLHATVPRIGPCFTAADAIVALEAKVARATAMRPDSASLVDVLLGRAREHARGLPPIKQPVLTHGRYHHGHIFICEDLVTVVDLDTVAIADPGRDIGEFLSRLRMMGRRARLGEDRASAAERAFIDGYTAAGGTIPPSLSYYWACSALHVMIHLLETGDPRSTKVDFVRNELEGIGERVARLSAAFPAA